MVSTNLDNNSEKTDGLCLYYDFICKSVETFISWGLILKCAIDNVLCLSSECLVDDNELQTTTSFFLNKVNICLNFYDI